MALKLPRFPLLLRLDCGQQKAKKQAVGLATTCWLLANELDDANNC